MDFNDVLLELDNLGFYSQGAQRSTKLSLVKHDIFDHFLYPREGTCPHVEFIPANPEGECWAGMNQLAKECLIRDRGEAYVEQAVFGILGSYPDAEINPGALVAFFYECKQFWSENQELLNLY